MSSEAQFTVSGRNEWRHYGGNIPPALLGMALVAIHSYTLGVVIESLEREYGWSRSEISSGPLLTSTVTLLLAVFGGQLVDRFGPRRVALIGMPLFASALALISTAGPDLTSWLLLHALLGVALMGIYPSVWTAAIAQRFEKNRGLALAIVLSGTGVASASVPLLAATFIEAFSWRAAYAGMSVLSFVLVYPLVLFLFARDKQPGHQSGGTAAKTPPKGTSAELFSPKFIRLAIGGLIYSLGATGIGANAVPILMEEGFSLIGAAKVAGLIGVGTIIGRIVGGLLLDRIDGRFVAMGCAVGALSAIAILLATEQSTWAASVACLLLGLTAGAEYDACAYLVTRHFSSRHFAALFGFLGGLFGFTAGVAPFIANTLYDVFGTYDSILMGVVPVFVVACLMFYSLGPYPDSSEIK